MYSRASPGERTQAIPRNAFIQGNESDTSDSLWCAEICPRSAGQELRAASATHSGMRAGEQGAVSTRGGKTREGSRPRWPMRNSCAQSSSVGGARAARGHAAGGDAALDRPWRPLRAALGSTCETPVRGRVGIQSGIGLDGKQEPGDIAQVAARRRVRAALPRSDAGGLPAAPEVLQLLPRKSGHGSAYHASSPTWLRVAPAIIPRG